MRAVNHPTKLYGYEMELLKEYSDLASRELEIWERFYLPVDPAGLTVLDIGAGCGETAAFYLAHGAEKVISIEPVPSAFSILKRNVEKNGLNVVTINDFFRLNHLSLEHDLMKMDIEGAEKLLLGYHRKLETPIVIEAHSDRIANSLIKKFLLKRVYRMTKIGCPQLSLLHLKDSPLAEYKTTWKDYLAMARVVARERMNIGK